MTGASTLKVGELVQGGGDVTWLHWVGAHSGVKQTKRWPYGDWALEFTFDPRRGKWPSVLERGRIIEQWYKGVRVWGGTIDSVDRDSGQVVAQGFCRLGEIVYALDGNGKCTARADLATLAASRFVRKAIPLGSLQQLDSAPWQQLPAATEANLLGAVYDAFADLNGQRWTVGANRVLWVLPDPTKPEMFVSSRDGFGVTTEALATHLLVGFLSSTTGEYDTVWVEGPGAARMSQRVERLMDVTEAGYMTAAQATTRGRNALKLSGEQAALTGSVMLRRGQVVNQGGAVVDPFAMTPGMIYRFQNQPDPRSTALYTDALIGETVWDEEEDAVQVTPLDAERQDLQAIIEAQGGSLVA